MFNGFNVPREREQQTFYGMMDNFFEALSESIDAEKEKIKEEVEAYQKAEETQAPEKQGEIHVHIHTGAAKTDPENKEK